MQVAIIADLHNNLENWRKINEILDWQNVQHLLIIGDITNIETLDKIAKDYSGSIHVVFGNMDQDIETMQLLADKYAHLHIHGFHGILSIAKKRFLLSHYQEEIEMQADKEEKYDVLCCGHTHDRKEKRTDKYLLINPGTAGGVFSDAYFALYDIKKDQVKFIKI